ncbi:MAG: hypothetical protein M0P00_02595 [Bacteroidaceae bacterium]|nr:hypothetical protein [Bacteroidaceae bacterium]
MPYRRLPNTDQARIRTLQQTIEKGERGDEELPVAFHTLSIAKNFLEKFDPAHFYYTQCYSNQVKNGFKHRKNVKNARLYISHFIQVLNLAVIRSEVTESQKKLYGLPAKNVVPDLTSENDIIELGKQIIRGEQNRIMQGGAPIFTPSIAKVKVAYDVFLDSFAKQKNLQRLTLESLENLSSMRKEADEIILDIWNQVEAKYQNITPLEARLNKCREYGIIYYNRKNNK